MARGAGVVSKDPTAALGWPTHPSVLRQMSPERLSENTACP